MSPEDIRFNPEETERFAEWSREVERTAKSPFEAARQIARYLGAHPQRGAGELAERAPSAGQPESEDRAGAPPSRRVVFGFWTPELAGEGSTAAGSVSARGTELPSGRADFPGGEAEASGGYARNPAPRSPAAAASEEDVSLEILVPEHPLDLTAREQQAAFGVRRLPTRRAGEYTWTVADGLVPGTRTTVGPFYRLSYRAAGGERRYILDPLACSVPFGAAAPAELYDVEAMLAGRGDASHFASLETRPDADGVPRVAGPVSMLEIHTATATEAGTLSALADRYRRIAERIRAAEPLSPADKSFIGYDAVQLMPVEPTIVYEAGPAFWEEAGAGSSSARTADAAAGPANAGAANTDRIDVTLRRPDNTNWGYDVMTVASPAPNPALLETGRPDELLELIETLHDFPAGPVMVVFDIVYGHADNQTLGLLNERFFAGANMYGQNLNYRNPVVRAILLEMQRRKSNYGVDGVRVDGAQDFTYWVPEEQKLYHDDDYLSLMNDVEQEVAGVRYRPWMVFEDGRPWPRDDWELASTYREVTRKLPNVVQWGPLTFAHNTPFLFTFWISKWWRIEEIMRVGSHWITGNSNHDTLRRGTQVSPDELINTYLGNTLPEILANAYDNPAARIFDVFMPGIPMDFLNANMRAPWSFIRNTDDRYGVKVISEEAYFLHWAVSEESFNREESFVRLKNRGFTELSEFRRFMRALDAAVRSTDYLLDTVARLLNEYEPTLPGPRPFTRNGLKEIARDWMDDVHDYCTVARHADHLDPARAELALSVRRFARMRPWLVEDLGPEDEVRRETPTDGSVVFYGIRRAPERRERILFVANMEGAPRSVVPADLPLKTRPEAGASWQTVLATPGLEDARADDRIELSNGSAVLFSDGRP